MSIGHKQMSIRPLDEQKCPLDIHMSIRPMDEQKCPFDIQMSIRLLGKQKCPVDIQMSIRPMDEQKCPVDIQMSIGHLAEVLDMYACLVIIEEPSSHTEQQLLCSATLNPKYSNSFFLSQASVDLQ